MKTKLLLISTLTLSGCFDLAYAPIWAATEVVAGARGHIDKYDLPAGVDKQEFMNEVQRLIQQIEWIDNYNATTSGEKIYLETRNLDGWACVAFSSYNRLPFLGIVPYKNENISYIETDCKEPIGYNKIGWIYTPEDNEFNNNRFPNLRKYYAISSGRTFLYVLDELKKQNKKFPNIPVRGLTAPRRNHYVVSKAFTESQAMSRYVRSIFVSQDYNEKLSYPYENRKGYYNVYNELNSKFYDDNHFIPLYLVEKEG